MKRLNSRKNNKMFMIFSGVLFIILGFLSYQGFIFYQLYNENNRLISLKDEYKILNEKINNYKQLKEQYEIVLSNSNDLNSSKEKLNDKVNELNKEINDLEVKINDINKKIKNIS